MNKCWLIDKEDFVGERIVVVARVPYSVLKVPKEESQGRVKGKVKLVIDI